ncbi:hypothetical protein G7Z17_g12519 [Cylindrodendrum hubeiense]|uniref:Uncharacterized protein n=1 Tax=Cylindrodendrum hubeiense TaxID=595255 RepID=A0A9P5L310_9HYPO|nr:hypothetical protein G7Z17_g12519 [Cylindrodendrum hubeiense]
MDEIYQKIADFNPIRFSSSPDVLRFEATELWRSDTTGFIRAVDTDVGVPRVPTWLAEETRDTGRGTESLVLRLVWTSLDFKNKTVGLPQLVLTTILAKFGLELAYSYFLSCVTGINDFPKTVQPGIEQQAHAFCYAPKFASIWSRAQFRDPSSPRQSATYGIVLAENDKKEVLKKLIHSKWQPNLATHAMFPAFLYTFLLDGEIEMTLAGLKPRIQAIEARTGYRDFKTKRDHHAKEALGELSAEMSGFASRLASIERKSMALEKLMDFILDRSGPLGQVTTPATSGTVPDGDSLMRNHTSVLQQRLSMQVLDKTYTLKRVQIQIEALVNLIGQRDSINNTDIALSSHRDASSMKTLAVVTMFFLPGSFIAALFSTSCFDWDHVNLDDNSIGVAPTPQFNLYWAITIPLTLLTFILYFAWLQFQTYKRKMLHAQAEMDQLGIDISNDQDGGEAKRISKLRHILTTE